VDGEASKTFAFELFTPGLASRIFRFDVLASYAPDLLQLKVLAVQLLHPN
jgi:hypothetical protein